MSEGGGWWRVNLPAVLLHRNMADLPRRSQLPAANNIAMPGAPCLCDRHARLPHNHTPTITDHAPSFDTPHTTMIRSRNSQPDRNTGTTRTHIQPVDTRTPPPPANQPPPCHPPPTHPPPTTHRTTNRQTNHTPPITPTKHTTQQPRNHHTQPTTTTQPTRHQPTHTIHNKSPNNQQPTNNQPITSQ